MNINLSKISWKLFVNMDERVRKAIEAHEDYERLKRVFSLEFVVSCLSNPRRGTSGSERWVGQLLLQHGANPTLFVSGVHYHELVELEAFRIMGYSDLQLGASKANDPNYVSVDTLAKRKEFEFYQGVAHRVVAKKPPFLAWSFSHIATIGDFGMRIPSFEQLYAAIKEHGFDFYHENFTLKDLQECIAFMKLGGDVCSGEAQAISLARTYLSGTRPVYGLNILEVM